MPSPPSTVWMAAVTLPIIAAVKVDRSREMVEALRRAGGKPKYDEYPGVPHNSWDKAYGTDEVLAAKPTAEYDAQWGEPKQFVTLAFQSTWGHLRDAYDTRLRNIA